MLGSTLKPLIKDTLRKRTNLPSKDELKVLFYRKSPLGEDNLSTKDKTAGPESVLIKRLHCTIRDQFHFIFFSFSFFFFTCLQCYKGPGFSVSINLNKPPAGIGPVLFEGRVRSCATCQVNNREEHVWSSYSAPVMCKWVRQTPLEIPGLMKAEKEEEKAVEGVKDYTKAYGILAFVLIAVFSVVLALILGQLFV